MATDTFRYRPDGLPPELLAADERALLRELGGPTLIRFPGSEEQPPRALTVLLHGDEPTGFQAARRVLRRQPVLPYDLYLFVGNVRAALTPPGYAIRFLDDQEDLNRIWYPVTDPSPLREAALTAYDHLEAAEVGALVDLHNTSGDTPFYAVVTRPTPATINLATLFSSRIVHWEPSNGALVQRIAARCPATAIECGLPGRPVSLDFALDGVRRYLTPEPVAADGVVRDHDLLCGLHRVTVPADVRFRFGGELGDDLDLVIPTDADRHNFLEVAEGHVLGKVRDPARLPVVVQAPDGRDVTADLVAVHDGELRLRRAAIPVMMTRTVTAVRKDCLAYLAVDPTRPASASMAATSMPSNRSSSGRSNGTSERSTTYDS